MATESDWEYWHILHEASKPIPKKRKKPRRVSVGRNQDYMDWLKTQFCVVCSYSYPGYHRMTMQTTPSEPAHTGKTNGMRSKSDDASCIPLCHEHHAEFDGRLNIKMTTKAAFAEKYGLNLKEESTRHYAQYLAQK